MTMEREAAASREQLIDDFNKVVADTEDLLRSAVSAGGEKATAWRANLEQSLRTTRARLKELEEDAMKRTTEAARATDQYVHENPWQAVAAAAGVGFLIGVLLSRR